MGRQVTWGTIVCALYCRTCLYLVSCCAYLPEAEDREVLATAYDIYSRQQQFPDAMRIALKMNDQARGHLLAALL